MKSSLLILSFLLLAVTTKLSTGEPVLDTEGQPLLPNVEYYFLPSYRVIGLGGVRAGRAGNSVHPVNVLQGSFREDLGEPVKFTPLEQASIIEEDTYLTIIFANTPEGVTSGNWITIADAPGRQTVGIGGPENHEGYQTFSGFFKLNRSVDGYKVSFLSDISGAHNGGLLSFIQDGIIRPFVAGPNGLPFIFQKVSVECS